MTARGIQYLVLALFALWMFVGCAQIAGDGSAAPSVRDSVSTAPIGNASAIAKRADALYNQRSYSEAESLALQALAIRENTLAPDHPDVGASLGTLAKIYWRQGRFTEAEPFFLRALAISEKARGPEHLDVAGWLFYVALLYKGQGRYAESEPLYKRSLEIRQKILGREHAVVGTTLSNLANLYRSQGRYAEAEPLYKWSLAILERRLGPNHVNVSGPLVNLAAFYTSQGRYSESEPLYKRSLAIREKALGPHHIDVGQTLQSLANLYRAQGRYAEAEPLVKRSLAILEKALGPDHRDVAESLNNLANLYRLQGRYADAEPLHKRSLAIREKALGPNHPNVAGSLNNLALLYKDQSRYAEAEPFYKRSLAIREKALGPNHGDVAGSLSNLANLYRLQGRYAEAELLYKRSLAIREKALGPNHRDVAGSLNNLALLYQAQGRYVEAEPLYKRSLAIREKVLGLEHPDVGRSLSNFSQLLGSQGRFAEALEYARRATGVFRKRTEEDSDDHGVGAQAEQELVRYVFLRHVQATVDVIAQDESSQGSLTGEGFEAGQLARASATAEAVSGMATRFAAGDGAMAEMVRARQDTLAEWRVIDDDLTKALSAETAQRDPAAEEQQRSRLKELDLRLSELGGRLAREFPAYAELTGAQPVTLAETQALLGPGEALLAYAVGRDATYLWVVRREAAELHRVAIGSKALGKDVSKLRQGLDSKEVKRLSDMPVFDTARAYDLYVKLFAPAEPLLVGIRHVVVVADGPLRSLPLGVLVTEKPATAVNSPARYRQTPWLARKYAMSVLPSVSSLRALRRFAKASVAPKPILGIGDPLLGVRPAGGRPTEVASLLPSRGGIDMAMVQALPALPETAEELTSLVRALGAGRESLLLREQATEQAVKQADLSQYRMLAFATHGLLAGEVGNLSEAALVLTQPQQATAEDDGLLTASEVAGLKLDADWVILSACNTAAGDGSPNADALSGLAKAFFYAGSRALLVSHWPVLSDAAVVLTPRALKEVASDPKIGRAEALRRAMLAMLDDPARPHFAHPMFWAPFVVVGEGGATGR